MSFATLFIAAIGMGAGGEAIRQYRGYKRKRRDIPRHIRNAGFWSDRRLYQTEALFACFAAAIPFAAITLAVSTNLNIVYNFAALIGYAALVCTLLRSFNLPSSD